MKQTLYTLNFYSCLKKVYLQEATDSKHFPFAFNSKGTHYALKCLLSS